MAVFYSPYLSSKQSLPKKKSPPKFNVHFLFPHPTYRGADKSLARPAREQATATEDFDVHISYSLS